MFSSFDLRHFDLQLYFAFFKPQRFCFRATSRMIPRNRRARSWHGSAKRSQYGLHAGAYIFETAEIGEINNGPLRCGQRLARPAQALSGNDCLQSVAGLLKLVVDQNVVILVVILDLAAGLFQAALDHSMRIFAALAQAPFQSLAVGWQYENADGFGKFLFDLRGSLHVDVEQEIVALLLGLAQETPRRAVVILSVETGVFQEFVGGDHLLKFLARDEVVLLAILLASTQGSRGVGDREIETRCHREQYIDQGRFSRSGGCGDDVDDRFVRSIHSRVIHSQIGHSRFCTCSRDFSISAFMARPASVMLSASPARPEVFESSVFASRFISCSRKSSFLPISPPSSSNARKCWMWVSRRTTSS